MAALNAVAFSPDGHRIACGFYDEVRVWNPDTGALLARLPQSGPYPPQVCFSPDGRCLAVASSKLFLYEASSYRLVRTLPDVHAVSFSSNGRLMLVAGTKLRLWDTVRWRKLAVYQEDYPNIPLAVLAPDGRHFADCCGDIRSQVRFHDTSTGRVLWSKFIPPFHPRSLAIDPSGRFVAAAGDTYNLSGTVWPIHLWDAASGKEVKVFPHQRMAITVAFSPDGRYLASGGEDRITLQPVPGGRQIQTPPNMQVWSTDSVCFSPDGRTVAFGGYREEHPTDPTRNGFFYQVKLWKIGDRELGRTFTR